MRDTNRPLAYFISFRCYGTWLHGDRRGSVDRRHGRNLYGAPRLKPSERWRAADAASLKHPPATLNAARRTIVEDAIREVCRHREYTLLAINARTDHVHTVVSAAGRPEPILNAFKAYATRALHEAGLVAPNVKPWSRHGSTRYLWKPWQVEAAVEYVINGQGDDLPKLVADKRRPR